VSAAPTAVERESRLRALQTALGDRPELMLLVILVLLLIGCELAQDGFLSLRQGSSILQSAIPLALLAAGQTLVMLTAGIDLSIAATATAAAYLLADKGSEGTPTAIAYAIGVGLAVGLFNGIGVGIFRVNPLIMTLGTAAIIVGLLNVYAQQFITGVPFVPAQVNELGAGKFFEYLPNSLLLFVPIAALILLGLRYSGFGRMLYAVGDNPVACRLAGVRVWQVQLATYVICAVLSALAGVLYVGLQNAADVALVNPYLLPAVAAVVVGGTSIFGGYGGYAGTILGALILTVLDTLLTLLEAAESVKQMLYGGIILTLAALYARLSGGSGG
jgi:ribose transport system permease protein